MPNGLALGVTICYWIFAEKICDNPRLLRNICAAPLAGAQYYPRLLAEAAGFQSSSIYDRVDHLILPHPAYNIQSTQVVEIDLSRH